MVDVDPTAAIAAAENIVQLRPRASVRPDPDHGRATYLDRLAETVRESRQRQADRTLGWRCQITFGSHAALVERLRELATTLPIEQWLPREFALEAAELVMLARALSGLEPSLEGTLPQGDYLEDAVSDWEGA